MTAKTVLQHSFRIAWKDLMELVRNRLGLIMLVLMPIFMMAMAGFIYPNTSGNSIDLSNYKIAVINQDLGINGNISISEDFITSLSTMSNTNFIVYTSESALNESIQSGAIHGAIIIPSDFSQNVLNHTQAVIRILADESNPTLAQTIKGGLASDVSIINARSVSNPYGVIMDTPSGYFNFIAPGIMMMTVMMSVMTGLPAAISHEREIGTMDGIMVAPINRSSIILGKTLAQITRGLLQGAIIMGLSVVLFKVTINLSDLPLIIGLLLLGVFSFVGLGIVLTSLAKDQETAGMIMMTLMFPMMFLSGVFFPIQQMPEFMQTISAFLPLTYASDALRKVMVLGAGIPQISTDLIVLIVFGAIMLAIAVPLFKRMMTR